MLATFTPPAIVAPVEAAYQPTEADQTEACRHFAMVDALRLWPELGTLLAVARMSRDCVGVVEAFDGYAEPAARPAKATEATF